MLEKGVQNSALDAAGVKSQGVEESASMAGRLLRSFVDTAVVGLSNTSVSHGDTGPRDGSRGKPPGGDEAPKVIDAVSPLQGAAPLPSTTVGRQFSIGPEVATGAPVPTQLLLNNVQSLVSSEGVLTNVEEKPSAPVRAPSIEPLPAILSTPKQNKAQSLAPTSPLDEGELATLGEKSSAPLRAPSIEPLPAILSPPKQLVNPVVSLGEPVSAPAPLESLLSEIAASGPQPSTESVLTVDALAHRPVGPVIAGPSKTTPVSTPPAALIVGKGVKATDFAHVEGATSKATDGGDGDVRGFASMRGPAVSVDQQTGK